MNTTNSNSHRDRKVLQIHASGRRSGSASRELSDNLVDALRQRHGQLELTVRDLADGIPLVDEAWIGANFTPDEERNPAHRETLALSDVLVAELAAADDIVIGVPIYNFGVPAALKAWVDMIARARLTFRYTDKGPEGLLTGKKAWLIVASGGVAVDSAVDFATPYMRQALRFVGITDIEIISADRINARGAAALDDARVQIADSVHTAPQSPARTA